MKKEDSLLWQRLKRVVDNWDRIPIRVLQEGKWQSLFLSEIKDERTIVEWIKERILNFKELQRE